MEYTFPLKLQIKSVKQQAQEQSQPTKKMEEVHHNSVPVDGLSLHVAELGTGPKVVVFLHGFPEIWYSWRHQMVALAKAGYRTIAPDFRGYGLSDPGPEPEKTGFSSVVNDVFAILGHFGIDKAFIVGKDFGARVAYLFALTHPERVTAVVTLGVPHLPPQPLSWLEHHPEGLYASRWAKPGRAEAEFGRLDAKTVVRNAYILFSRSEVPIAAEDQEIMDLVDDSAPLPPWFSEKDLAEYGTLYEKSGFRTALQMPYRSFQEEFGISEPTVKVPALLIMGAKDYVLKVPGMEEYIKTAKAKDLVPDLDIIYLPDGTHFVQEQLPEEVNQLIINFLKKHN